MYWNRSTLTHQPSPYQDEQCSMFPGLIPYVAKEGKSQASHVAKNLRILLKQRFPDTLFSVAVQRVGTSTRSVQVAWTYFRDPPVSARKKEVESLAGAFCGMSRQGEELTEDQARQRYRFRSVFGQVDYVTLSQVRPTKEQLRRHRLKHLEAALPAAVPATSRPRM